VFGSAAADVSRGACFEADRSSGWLQGVLAQPRVRASTRQAQRLSSFPRLRTAQLNGFRDMLTEAIGAGCPEATGAAVTSGATDPYSLDAYTHVPPGAARRRRPARRAVAWPPSVRRRRRPCSARLEYTDGALASGIQEANESCNNPTPTSARVPTDSRQSVSMVSTPFESLC